MGNSWTEDVDLCKTSPHRLSLTAHPGSVSPRDECFVDVFLAVRSLLLHICLALAEAKSPTVNEHSKSEF